jgi:hypothetical protein
LAVVTARRHRWLRAVGRTLAAAGGVALTRWASGPWITGLVVASAAMWWGLRTWARIEARTRRARVRLPVTAIDDRQVLAASHVAFARGLAAVADAYLTTCEREEAQP